MQRLDGRELIVAAGVGQVYHVQLTIPTQYGGPPLMIHLGARGFSYAEVLELIGSLQPATIESYRAHASLLIDPYPHDQVFDALVGALDRGPPPGMAIHMVERISLRQDGVRDQLPDPYHTPRYAGQTEQTTNQRMATPGLASLTISGVGVSIEPHPRWFYSDQTPFEGALLDAYALRVTSRLVSGDTVQDVNLYQGEAARFGGYLRAVARWRTSQPVTLDIGGRTVQGWQVVPAQAGPQLWTLFELDGTLVAISLPPEQLSNSLGLLRPIRP